jgi:hypothetical protein
LGNQILDSMVPMYMAHGGAILIAVVLPTVAFFLIDGAVALVRGRGVVPLLIAVGMVIGVAAIGAAMWQGGLSQLEGNPAYAVTSAGAEGNFRMLVGWALALGAIAFLARMAKLAFGRRSRA